MPRPSGLPGLALLALVLVASRVPAADYTLRVDDADPLWARVTLKLPPSNGQPRELTLRGVGWGLRSQVSEVRGETSLLTSPGDGRWIAPADCRTVSWKLRFRDSVSGPVTAAAQENVYFRSGHWWLISEPTALLRLQDTLDESSLTFEPEGTLQAGGTRREGRRWHLPGQAPEFFVVGRARPEEADIDGFRVRYVADDPRRVAELGLQRGHAAAFRYLLTLFPRQAGLPEEERRLLVVWIGIDAAAHTVGGAAGGRSFVANYLYGAGDPDNHAASSLMVVAHEQFHQLTDMSAAEPGPGPPTWANESLAQYFGLKALSRSGLPPSTVSRVRERFVDPSRVVEQGLGELSQAFEGGDRSVYPLFYSQGATFWAEVDRAVAAGTDGEQALDDLLPMLLRSEWAPSGAPPGAFLDALHDILGARTDELLLHHFGS